MTQAKIVWMRGDMVDGKDFVVHAVCPECNRFLDLGSLQDTCPECGIQISYPNDVKEKFSQVPQLV